MPTQLTYNTDPSFVGVDEIKRRQKEQLAQFEEWASQGHWDLFHENHFDWWMFPIDEPSNRYGEAWTVYEGEIVELAPAQQIWHDPQHEYTKKLLESFPRLTGERGVVVR